MALQFQCEDPFWAKGKEDPACLRETSLYPSCPPHPTYTHTQLPRRIRMEGGLAHSNRLSEIIFCDLSTGQGRHLITSHYISYYSPVMAFLLSEASRGSLTQNVIQTSFSHPGFQPLMYVRLWLPYKYGFPLHMHGIQFGHCSCCLSHVYLIIRLSKRTLREMESFFPRLWFQQFYGSFPQLCLWVQSGLWCSSLASIISRQKNYNWISPYFFHMHTRAHTLSNGKMSS